MGLRKWAQSYIPGSTNIKKGTFIFYQFGISPNNTVKSQKIENCRFINNSLLLSSMGLKIAKSKS